MATRKRRQVFATSDGKKKRARGWPREEARLVVDAYRKAKQQQAKWRKALVARVSGDNHD
jgi:predicted trehalose synthase